MEEKFTFFWSGPFSQWHKAKMEIDELEYNCCEQYMMACKAYLFKDMDMYEKIMESDNPKFQKDCGRLVKGFNEEVWNSCALATVCKGNYHKFTQHGDLKNMLLATAGTTLVEASPFDCIWGIGLSEGDPLSWNKKTWRGKNWLGQCITKVREIIVDEERGN